MCTRTSGYEMWEERRGSRTEVGQVELGLWELSPDAAPASPPALTALAEALRLEGLPHSCSSRAREGQGWAGEAPSLKPPNEGDLLRERGRELWPVRNWAHAGSSGSLGTTFLRTAVGACAHQGERPSQKMRCTQKGLLSALSTPVAAWG